MRERERERDCKRDCNHVRDLLRSAERTKAMVDCGMGAPKRADWREERRKRAGEGGGVEALPRRPPPGMTPRLSAEQRAQLPALLAPGAKAYGFRGDVWTARRVAPLIAETFGVRYHRDHVGRLLRQLGWSQ